MRKIYQPLKRQNKVFDKATRENYFEKLDQALFNLSIVNEFKEKKILKVKNKVELVEETVT